MLSKSNWSIKHYKYYNCGFYFFQKFNLMFFTFYKSDGKFTAIKT